MAMGDCVPAIPPPSFCDMITYNVTKDIHTPIPDPHNVKELDDIAKDIYFTAIEVRFAVLGCSRGTWFTCLNPVRAPGTSRTNT
jgi:hypothetical protein